LKQTEKVHDQIKVQNSASKQTKKIFNIPLFTIKLLQLRKFIASKLSD